MTAFRWNSERAQISEVHASDDAQKPKVSDEPPVSHISATICHPSLMGGF